MPPTPVTELDVTVISSAMPMVKMPPKLSSAHSITETLVSVASPQSIDSSSTAAHSGVSLAADGPVPTPAAAHTAAVGEVPPAFAV